jgi:hypothetical protein
MLDRKGRRLDLQETGIAQQAMGMDAQRMSCQFGALTGTQAAEGVGVIGFDLSCPCPAVSRDGVS